MTSEEITISKNTQRRPIIVAVIIAALLAGLAWYGLFGRVQDTTDADLYSPTETTDSAFSSEPITISDLPPLDGPLPSELPAAINTNPQVAGQSVPANAPTGAGEFILAASLATIIGGAVGLRNVRKI